MHSGHLKNWWHDFLSLAKLLNPFQSFSENFSTYYEYLSLMVKFCKKLVLRSSFFVGTNFVSMAAKRRWLQSNFSDLFHEIFSQHLAGTIFTLYAILSFSRNISLKRSLTKLSNPSESISFTCHYVIFTKYFPQKDLKLSHLNSWFDKFFCLRLKLLRSWCLWHATKFGNFLVATFLTSQNQFKMVVEYAQETF